MSQRISVFLLGLFVTLALLGTASAQLGTRNSKYGSNASRVGKGTPVEVAPFAFYNRAEYATGGVGLRNQNQRSIIISGLPSGSHSQDAYIYWSVLLFTTSPPAAVQSITVTRTWPVGPNAASVTVLGDLIAIGGDPCWGSVGNYIYRAHLPVTVANGNGNYMIRLLPGASGLTDGEDPWYGPLVPPLFEGAGMVVVGTGTHTVSIFDAQAGMTFAGLLSYTLNLPYATSAEAVLWDNIGADGQIGQSRTAVGTSKTTSINNVQISGPGGLDTDSDWNGSAGFPLPQLFDVTGHDISAAAPGGTTSLSVIFNSPGDCVTTVANVVSQ